MRPYLFTPRCSLLAALFIAFLGRSTLVAGDEPTVVHIDVYYESLCGDSMRWITNQLVPSYPELKDHLNVTFIPYGKATHHRESDSAPWQFMCQHGSAECQGNKAQSCAINEIEIHEESNKHQQLTVNLVGCVMSNKNPATAVPQCAQTVSLKAETQQAINDCLSGSKASDLLAANGDRTWALNPPLSFVPTIVFNGEPSREHQATALNNFAKLVCNFLPQAEKPSICERA